MCAFRREGMSKYNKIYEFPYTVREGVKKIAFLGDMSRYKKIKQNGSGSLLN